MRIINNIKTFLYDKNYFINIYENKIHVFNYQNLEELSNTNIVLKMENFTLLLIGEELHISKMADNEVLITGILSEVRFVK